MTRTIHTVVFLALLSHVTKCHITKCHMTKEHDRNKSDHSREKRSCYVCEYVNYPPPPPPPGFGPPPPPPPPGFGPPPPLPYFRTQNWSGLSRSADGSQHGVFSGSSAATNYQPMGQAFSVASSSAGASALAPADDAMHLRKILHARGQAGGVYSGLSGYNDFGSQSGFRSQSADNGAQSTANAQTQAGGGQYSIGFNDHNSNGKEFEEQQQTSDVFGVDRGDFGESHNNGASSAYGFGSGNEQQVQSTDGGFGDWQRHAHGPEPYQDAASLRGDDEQQAQSSGSGQWEQGNFRSHADSGSSYGGALWGISNSANSGDSGTGSSGFHQKPLSGAFNLAFQGLQKARQNAATGCSTCGKESYAFSNANSDSGDAISLSIGR